MHQQCCLQTKGQQMDRLEDHGWICLRMIDCFAKRQVTVHADIQHTGMSAGHHYLLCSRHMRPRGRNLSRCIWLKEADAIVDHLEQGLSQDDAMQVERLSQIEGFAHIRRHWEARMATTTQRLHQLPYLHNQRMLTDPVVQNQDVRAALYYRLRICKRSKVQDALKPNAQQTSCHLCSGGGLKSVYSPDEACR